MPEHLIGLRLTFAQGEDQLGADQEVVLSYRLWQRRFGGKASVLGSQITLGGEGYTVVGIMPSTFKFAPFWAPLAELWAPYGFADRIQQRGGNSLRVFARLKPDIPLASARAEMATITARLERQFPGTNRGLAVTPLKENVVGKVRTPLLLLLGAVGLLIACANVAHMLLARTADRQKEIAVRLALGAGQGRVMGQLLTENLLLSLAGAAAGLLLALWGTKVLVSLSPAYLPGVETVSLDAKVDGNRLRGFLVASEFALAFILLIGAGLMIRSFFALQSVDPGFDPHNVLSMVVSVAGSKEAAPGARGVFYRQLLQQVRPIPGVQSAAGINHLPLAGDLWGYNFEIEGRPRPRPGEAPGDVYRIAMPGYFETMRLRLLNGRSIAESDDARTPGVVVINHRAAGQYWPGANPIGQRITFNADANPPTWLTIIGVAADEKLADWAVSPQPAVYLAALQNNDFLNDPAAQRKVWSFDRNLPISSVLTMDRVVADATAQPRFEMLLPGMFAAVALILAAIGIYGVMNYSVARRRREIRIRISLGSSRADVLRMVVRQGMLQALTGTVAGIAGALLLSRFIVKILYGMHPADPVTFGAVAIVLRLAALFAVCIPARRASRIEPMVALRSE